MKLIDGKGSYLDLGRGGIYLMIERHWETINWYETEFFTLGKSLICGCDFYTSEVEKFELVIKHLPNNQRCYILLKIPKNILQDFIQQRGGEIILAPFYIDDMNRKKRFSIDFLECPQGKRISIQRIITPVKIEYDISGEEVKINTGKLKTAFIEYLSGNPGGREYIINTDDGKVTKTHTLKDTEVYVLRYYPKEKLTPGDPRLSSTTQIPKKYTKNLTQSGKYYYYTVRKNDNYSSISPFIQKKSLKETVIWIEDKPYLSTVKLLLFVCDINFLISDLPTNPLKIHNP